MVLTTEEKKLRKIESNKRNYEKNKEKAKEHNKEYYKVNKDKLKEYQNDFYKTPKGKKIHTIFNWKRYGLIHENMGELYNRYLDTTECDVCKYIFDETNWRCMDHCHITGLFRQILCNKCNVKDNWKKIINPIEILKP